MNEHAICTITTVSHLFKTYALAESIQHFGYKLNVLVVDSNDCSQFSPPTSVCFFTLNEIKSLKSKEMALKYRNNKDKLRWGLKPVFLAFLLETHVDVIYCDNDVYFFKTPEFYFAELVSHSVLLTPHFYSSDTGKNQNWLEANFTVGLFNAGFVGASREGSKALRWWANCCLYNLKKSHLRGLFDDQKYLDLFPVLFEKVRILKDIGTNLAGWNDEVLQPVEKEVRFIHFAELTMRRFKNEESRYNPFYKKYMEALRRYNPNYVFKPVYLSKYSILAFIRFTLWKINRSFEK